jgi:endonuclease YncB( thermonuclease family)
MKRANLLVMLIIFLMLGQMLTLGATSSPQVNIDLTGKATYVVDGDTFDVTVANGTQYRIRLADVNASEKGQVGYGEASNYLDSLVFGKTVYLDVDDVYVYDYQGTGDRLVCVPYVEYNSTHFLNVNQALLEAGQVEVKDYDNEFNPDTWSLYISKQAIPEFSPFSLFTVTSILTLIILYLKKTGLQARVEAKQE